LVEEVDRIINSPGLQTTMKERAKAFARVDSANIIADAILDIALQHEN
jgi:UDP-N-acetylglucosamine:LPS N-acetylglucosamine transferase